MTDHGLHHHAAVGPKPTMRSRGDRAALPGGARVSPTRHTGHGGHEMFAANDNRKAD